MSEGIRVLRLLRIERTVSSLSEAVGFYCDALGFQMEGEPDVTEVEGRRMRTARLRLGEEPLWLTQFDPPGEPYPAESTSADPWFQHIAIVTPDIEGACKRLMRFPHTAITQGGPVQLPPETGSVVAYKFRDPDGHPLELIHFPAGTGDERWQQADKGALTIGIDHSAISVSDSETSIPFYRDVLALKVAARQINQGPAQEQLDALQGDIVEVIALQPAAAATPHLELLVYECPKGRIAPILVQPWDIAGDRLVLEVEFAFIKPGDCRDINNGAMVRDPDGHMLFLFSY